MKLKQSDDRKKLTVHYCGKHKLHYHKECVGCFYETHTKKELPNGWEEV